MPTKIIWCEPFHMEERKDARVRPDEVPTALAFFKRKLGHDVHTVFLNSKMISKIGGAFPEDIEIIMDNGVASWAVAAAVDDGGSPSGLMVSPDAPDSPQNKREVGEIPPTPSVIPPKTVTRIQKGKKTPPNQNLTQTVTRGRRNRRTDVTKRVTKRNKAEQLELMATRDTRIIQIFRKAKTKREKSSRTITKKLKKEGFNISHMTVSRTIQKYLASKKEVKS